MNKIKLLTVASSLVMASSLLAPTVANAVIISSGTNCMAANLTQALAGIGWSQFGVKNNATSSFFVVCPMEWDSTVSATGVVVFATFPGSGVIECTARTLNSFTGTFNSVAFTVSSGEDTGTPVTGTSTAILPLKGYNNTIVCALDPGEGVSSLYYS